MLPTLFLSHGSPMTALRDSPARRFFQGLGPEIEAAWGRPKAILVASAHWETMQPAVNSVAVNDTIHDFGGFPRPLHEMQYPAPGAPAVADRVAELLAEAGLPCGIDRQRGLDHGAWVPLSLIWPAADIPVLQVSIQSHLGPAHHMQVGRALAPLRNEGVLIVGSGSFTHNLRILRRESMDAPQLPGAIAFADWFHGALSDRRTADLLTYRTRAPAAEEQHPTDEHLLPIYVALGAAGEGAKARRLHDSVEFGALRMDAYEFAA